VSCESQKFSEYPECRQQKSREMGSYSYTIRIAVLRPEGTKEDPDLTCFLRESIIKQKKAGI
jgi:hypothetical protein